MNQYSGNNAKRSRPNIVGEAQRNGDRRAVSGVNSSANLVDLVSVAPTAMSQVKVFAKKIIIKIKK